MGVPVRLATRAALLALGRHDRRTRAELEAYQARELRRLREHACARSPFCRRFHRGLADRPLDELPVLTKDAVTAHVDERVTDPAVRLAGVEAHVAAARGGERLLVTVLVNRVQPLVRYELPDSGGRAVGFLVRREVRLVRCGVRACTRGAVRLRPGAPRGRHREPGAA